VKPLLIGGRHHAAAILSSLRRSSSTADSRNRNSANLSRTATPSSGADFAGPIRDWMIAVVSGLHHATQRSGTRRRLAELDGRMLRDIGVSPTGRNEEIRKWWWQR
jgi:uncharacterized protein YjiS (DUF1127 family)